MKTGGLAVLLASISCAVIPIYGQSASENTGTNKAKANNSHPPKADSVNVGTVNVMKLNVPQQAETTGKSDNNGKESKSYFSRLIAPENLPNLILCAVGVAGVFVALRTLKQFRRQTDILAEYNKATRESADATIKNTTAIIDSQRARLVIEIVRNEKQTQKRGALDFQGFVTNTSPTVAQIIAVRRTVYHFTKDEYKKIFENAALIPPSEDIPREPHVILAHGKWCFGTVHDFELEPYEVQIRLGREDIFTAWYGHIDFRDFVGKEHRQRFFFMYGHKTKSLFAHGPTGQNAEEY